MTEVVVNAPPSPAPAPPAEPEMFSKEYVRELREENKGWRLKVSTIEASTKAMQDASTAAEAVAVAKAAEVAAAADQRVIRAELKTAALKAGMVDLDGLKLADLSTVKMSESGEVEGAETLMAELKKAKPYLFGAASTSFGGKPPPADPPKNKHAREMTDPEYASAKSALTGRR